MFNFWREKLVYPRIFGNTFETFKKTITLANLKEKGFVNLWKFSNSVVSYTNSFQIENFVEYFLHIFNEQDLIRSISLKSHWMRPNEAMSNELVIFWDANLLLCAWMRILYEIKHQFVSMALIEKCHWFNPRLNLSLYEFHYIT